MEPSDLEIFNLKKKEKKVSQFVQSQLFQGLKQLDEGKEKCEREKTSKVSQLTESLEQTSVTNAVNADYLALQQQSPARSYQFIFNYMSLRSLPSAVAPTGIAHNNNYNYNSYNYKKCEMM